MWTVGEKGSPPSDSQPTTTTRNGVEEVPLKEQEVVQAEVRENEKICAVFIRICFRASDRDLK